MSTEEEKDVIELIYLANLRRSESDISHLERLADLADRILGQKIVLEAAKNESVRATVDSINASSPDPIQEAEIQETE
jgi:hypothetical protein